jgi:hypothetical protein
MSDHWSPESRLSVRELTVRPEDDSNLWNGTRIAWVPNAASGAPGDQ